MHFFNVNQAKNSENNVKIASDEVEGLESGRFLSTDTTNLNPVQNSHLRRPLLKPMDAIPWENDIEISRSCPKSNENACFFPKLQQAAGALFKTITNLDMSSLLQWNMPKFEFLN